MAIRTVAGKAGSGRAITSRRLGRVSSSAATDKSAVTDYFQQQMGAKDQEIAALKAQIAALTGATTAPAAASVASSTDGG